MLLLLYTHTLLHTHTHTHSHPVPPSVSKVVWTETYSLYFPHHVYVMYTYNLRRPHHSVGGCFFLRREGVEGKSGSFEMLQMFLLLAHSLEYNQR